MERERKKRRGNSEEGWESGSMDRAAAGEGSDLTGQSHGTGLHVPSQGVGVRAKHGGLRKMKPLPRQIRRAGHSL